MERDEAYVSGNLSSGGFPSIGGDEKDAPCSAGPSLSLGSEVGVERRKVGSKGRDAVGKGLSQLSGRRKNASHSRRVGYGEGKAGSAAKNLGPVAGSLPTPTTALSKQIHEMGLASPLVTLGGKRTLAERADDVSPMSDTEVQVGGGPSLNDPGYGSLSQSHGPASLERPPSSLSRERGGGGGGEGNRTVGDSRQDTLPPGHKQAGMYATHTHSNITPHHLGKCGAYRASSPAI